jgi:hypothetical protein
MLFKLFIVGLIATTAICEDVKEKGNLDDLIDNVFTQGRNDGEAAKVSRKLSTRFTFLQKKIFLQPCNGGLGECVRRSARRLKLPESQSISFLGSILPLCQRDNKH